MQRLRSLLVPAVLVTWTLHAPGPIAQEPRTPEPRSRAERSRPDNESPRAQSQDPRRGRGRFGGRRRGLTVIEAAVVHPVSGPPIENGVVVIRGERILAVGLPAHRWNIKWQRDLRPLIDRYTAAPKYIYT